MVGWFPSSRRDRLDSLPGFQERVKKSHNIDAKDSAFILQYDSHCADLRPWMWPEGGAVKIKPDDLDLLRLTHHFKGPSCFCAWLDGTSFTEAKMGVALLVVQPGTPDCLGQYVAFCATQTCGYLVYLEKFYSHPSLLAKEYPRRDTPLRTLDPFVFLTDDTEETAKRAGLRQFQVLQDNSDKALRGSRLLLRREDPHKFAELENSIEKLLRDGLPGGEFWDLFTQCMTCNFVMPRHHFPYYHKCVKAVVQGSTVHAPRPYRLRAMDSHGTDGSQEYSNNDSLPKSYEESSASSRDSTPSLGSDDSLPDLLEVCFGKVQKGKTVQNQ